jgi:hypothetical protein
LIAFLAPAHNWFCKEDKCLYVAPQSGEVCGVVKCQDLPSTSCYGIPDGEWEKWSKLLFDPDTAPVTHASYIKHIQERVKSDCPTIAKVVLDLLQSCPSEATVERLFSELKYSFNQWRNSAGCELVNGVLRTQSGYTFYHPVLELPDYEPPKDDTPAKAARAEGQAAVTPVHAAVPPLPV